MSRVATDKSTTLQKIPMACADERAAVEFMEDMRWGDEPACPRCGDVDVYKMTKRGSDERNERYLWRCRGCGRQYTVRIGTVMEESPIPLRHWCFAFWQACAGKKGVSALQIKRQTGLTYKSALFMMHRIRLAMADSGTGPLSGDVEVDETYVGGKPRRPAKASKEDAALTGRKHRMGPAPDFKDRKTPVMALIQRDGEARAYVPTDVTGGNLKDAIRESVDRSARIHTDERRGYEGIGDEFEGGHHTVKHSDREYGRWDDGIHVTINEAESFFALIKRAIVGTFHNVSRKHLHRYVSEAEFKWNTRKLDDGARIHAAIRGAEGKRLMYKHP